MYFRIKTYNIDRNNLAEEVDVEASEETEANTEALRFITKTFFAIS